LSRLNVMRGGGEGHGRGTLRELDDFDIGGVFGKKLPYGLQTH
jgi:hypothetical protein